VEQALRGGAAVRCSHSLQRVEDLQNFAAAWIAQAKLRSLAGSGFRRLLLLKDADGFTGFLPFALLQFVGQRCDAAACLRWPKPLKPVMKKPQP
jgi:hypothetical protein